MAITVEHLIELQKLYDQLKERILLIEKKYSLDVQEPTLDLPERLNLEKLTYEPKTEQVLLALAEQKVGATILSKQASLNKNYSDKLKSISTKKDQLQLKYSTLFNNMATGFSDQLDDIKRKVINHGLIFSTVADKYRNQAQSAYKASMAAQTQQYNSELAIINNEQTATSEAYNQSLTALEQERQSRIDYAYTQLVEAEQKQQESIEKYNNSLEEKEQKYQASRAKAYEAARKTEENRVYKLVEMYAKIGATAYVQMVEKEKYSTTQDVMYPLSRDDAKLMLTFDSFLKTHLGSYYSTLVSWINTTLLP